jgi:hypothetical protein
MFTRSPDSEASYVHPLPAPLMAEHMFTRSRSPDLNDHRGLACVDINSYNLITIVTILLLWLQFDYKGKHMA